MTQPLETSVYDFIIIGWGKAGKTLAAAVANTGKTVALVERSPEMYGGSCINVACIPSKSLARSAKQADYFHFDSFADQSEFYSQAIAETSALTSTLNKKNFDKLDQHPNVSIYTGQGSFVSANEVKVETEDGAILLQAYKIIINTGASPTLPDDIDGLRDNPFVYTSESLMKLAELPRDLVIIGCGSIALEFASIYAGFGSRVTMLVRGERILQEEDSDVADEISKVLSASGIDIKLGAVTESVSREGIVSYRSGSAERPNDKVLRTLGADAVLAATGRTLGTADLNLEAAGVETGGKGEILVDEFLRTTASNIWAVGDVRGGMQETYLSLDDYRIVMSQLRGTSERSTLNRGAIPRTLFIDPPYSRVGLTEAEARAQGYHVVVNTLAAASIPTANVLQEPRGILKAVVDQSSKRILGAALFCAESQEMINQVKLAIDAGLPCTAMRDAIYIHPSMSEAYNDLFAL